MGNSKKAVAPEAGATANKENEATATENVETTNEATATETVETTNESAATETVETEETDLVEIKFLLSPVKKFSLGYNVGETGFFEEKQAAELVEAKYAEYVK